MAATRHILLGAIWVAVGAISLPITVSELWDIATREEYGLRSGFYDLTWFLSQSLFPLFLAAAIIVGVGLMADRRWSIGLLKVLGPILLINCTAYSIFGGERAWWAALLGLGGVVLGVYSVRIAYRRDASPAA